MGAQRQQGSLECAVGCLEASLRTSYGSALCPQPLPSKSPPQQLLGLEEPRRFHCPESRASSMSACPLHVDIPISVSSSTIND